MTQPANITGAILTRAAREAAAPPEASVFDVWAHTGTALANPSSSGAEETAGLADLAEGFGAGVQSSDASDVGSALGQQAGAIADQAAQLFHLGDQPSPDGILGH